MTWKRLLLTTTKKKLSEDESITYDLSDEFEYWSKKEDNDDITWSVDDDLLLYREP